MAEIESSRPESAANPIGASGSGAAASSQSREIGRRTSPLLLIEPDAALATQLAAALVRTADELGMSASVEIANGLADLVLRDVGSHRLAFISMELTDGTGMDALAYLLAVHPTLGAVIYADDCNESVIRETIMNGAIDCVERTPEFEADLIGHFRTALARLEARDRTDVLRRKLTEALGKMTDELGKLRHRVSQLESLAITDELTGVYNRRFMNSALEDLWRGSSRNDRSLGCMILDINRFKELNDQFGHQSGDAALYVLGEVLRENCRRSDIITRYGGDEFCILMPDTTLEQARDIALRIETAFKAAGRALLQDDFDVSLSIGVSITTLSLPRSPMQLIAHADEAMYAAKRVGEPVRARGPLGILAA